MAIKVTIHRGDDCADDETCPAFATIDTDPAGGYVIGKQVTDPDVLTAFAHKIGAGEVLSRVPRRYGPEVFTG